MTEQAGGRRGWERCSATRVVASLSAMWPPLRISTSQLMARCLITLVSVRITTREILLSSRSARPAVLLLSAGGQARFFTRTRTSCCSPANNERKDLPFSSVRTCVPQSDSSYDAPPTPPDGLRRERESLRDSAVPSPIFLSKSRRIRRRGIRRTECG